MKTRKSILIMLLGAVLFLSGGCGNPLLKSLQESLQETENHPGNDSQIEEETPLDNEHEDEKEADENGAADGSTRYQKSYGSYLILDGWIEVDRSTDTKSFYAKEGTEDDLHPDNISVEVGTAPYSLEEHEEFARAIQEQLAAQLAQIGRDTTLTGSGTATEKGDIVYVFTIEEAGKKAAVQYYIVGEQRYCMVYETIYYDEAGCDEVAQKIVESFEWAE